MRVTVPVSETKPQHQQFWYVFLVSYKIHTLAGGLLER